jgi:hypothetical protein
MMYRVTNEYYKKFNNVTTIYYAFKPDLNCETEIIDNILYIRGKEGYLPGILEKTVKAFKYVATHFNDYNYIIRTNASTIVNFNLLTKKLTSSPIDYGASYLLQIGRNYRDPDCGIVDDRYEGVIYASGTGIIFSRNVFMKMIQKIDMINYGVIDDVAIGQLMQIHFPDIKLVNFMPFYGIIKKKEDMNKLNYNEMIFYRNKSMDRMEDVDNMNIIVNRI